MLSDWITDIDLKILDWIAEHLSSDAFDWFFPKFTFLGDNGWIFILLAIILLLIPKCRIWGAKLAASLTLGLVFGNIMLKNSVMRIRPYNLVQDVVLLVDKLKDYSFPSGHTMAAFEFCTVVCYMPVRKGYKMLAVASAILMAFSRLYLYVHFPTDVLAGALLGILFGAMGVRTVDICLKKQTASI